MRAKRAGISSPESEAEPIGKGIAPQHCHKGHDDEADDCEPKPLAPRSFRSTGAKLLLCGERVTCLNIRTEQHLSHGESELGVAEELKEIVV